MGFPSLYEVNLRLRYELGSDSKRSEAEPARPEKKKRGPWNLFFTLQQGMVWWHSFDPRVVSLTQGTLGFRYAWFEAELGFGSPAWGKFRKKGLYEVFLRVGFHSYRKGRLRLRHTAAFGVLFHNPPFESHTSWPPVHVDFATLDVFLGAGVWVSLSPLTVSALPRYHLSSSLGIRYEVF